MKKNFFNLIFWLTMWHVGSQFPHQGSNPHPLQWKHGVLTTEPPEKSQKDEKFCFLEISTVKSLDEHSLSHLGMPYTHTYTCIILHKWTYNIFAICNLPFLTQKYNRKCFTINKCILASLYSQNIINNHCIFIQLCPYINYLEMELLCQRI